MLVLLFGGFGICFVGVFGFCFVVGPIVLLFGYLALCFVLLVLNFVVE